MVRTTRLRHWVFPFALFAVAAAPAPADPIISEFMVYNSTTLADIDGNYSAWVEIYNPDATAVNLAGWYLSDNAAKKTKWQFPAVTLPANAYLVVIADSENRVDANQQIHTNFAFGSSGAYLGLIKPDGVTTTSQYGPGYPTQFYDISYGVTQPANPNEPVLTGYFRTATPGKPNGNQDNLLPVNLVTFSQPSGPFTAPITLTLSGAVGDQRIRYVIAPPSSSGATVPDPTASSTLYTGPITISSSVIVRAAVFTADGLQSAAATSAHFLHLATSGPNRLDTFSSQLPVIVVDTHGFGPLSKDGIYHPAWSYAWNIPSSGKTTLLAAPTVASAAATTVHGQSSATFPKKSLDLNLNDQFGLQNPQPLLGLGNFYDWVLVGPWYYDCTFLHNAFVYALSNQIGRWAAHTQFVEVFANFNGGDLDATDYVGIYELTDALDIDPNRVAITNIKSTDTSTTKITGGYLVKVDVPDSTHFNFETKRNFPGLPEAVTIDSPSLATLASSQSGYLQNYVQTFEDALFTNYAGNWQQRSYTDSIDLGSWVDHHILETLVMNTDAFYRSAYFTKDRSTPMAAGPVWDFDRALGGGDVRTQNPTVWNDESGAGATELWVFGWWGVLARDPEFMQAWIDRWQQLRQRQFATANLTGLVDSLAAQIGPAAAARDAAQWPDDAGRFPNGWQGEIDNMKSWLAQRTTWIDSQFAAAPTVTDVNGTLTITPAPGTQLAYTTDGTDPRALLGLVANGAKLSSAPITLPDTTNVEARSYNAKFNPATVPGSPWSSAAGGPNSATLTPRPRLFNLSSRGFVGTGANNLVAGVVVSGTAGKQYLARAIGPGLAGFGFTGFLPDPVLQILDATGKQIAANTNWQTDPNAGNLPTLAASVGAFPLSKTNRDSALVATLPYGQYTLQVSSASGGTGIGLAELYELDPTVGRTLNLSTRGLVTPGAGVLVGGLVVRGPGPKRILIRAVGPTLGVFGVPGTLDDPVITLYSSSNAVIATNDDWGTPAGTTATAADISSASSAVGAFGLSAGSKDASLLLTLAPGAYTAIASGKGGASGVVLLEVYELP
jgi:hypothetical protein